VDVEGHIFGHDNDKYLINSWSINDFAVEKEASVVKIVQNVRKSDKDNDFINDGDIEVFHDSREEDEEEFNDDMPQDEA